MSTLAYPLLVLTVTGSPGQAGLVASVLAATTFLLRIPAGVVADRVDRRRLMLACDAGRAVAVSSVGVAAFTGHILLAHIVVVAVVEGALGTLFGPAEAVAVRRVVAPGQIQDAVAQNEIRRQVAGLVGPTIGGALGLGRAWPFVADAASYLVSLLAVSTIRTPLRDGPRRSRTTFRAELMEGLRWLWNQRFLRAISLWLAFAGVLFTSMGLVTLVLARELGASPAELGAAYTITGAGGLLGALAAPRILRTVGPGALVISYAWIAAAATFAMLVAGSVGVIGLIGAAAFFLVPAVNALVISQVALRVPDALHGRVISATCARAPNRPGGLRRSSSDHTRRHHASSDYTYLGQVG